MVLSKKITLFALRLSLKGTGLFHPRATSAPRKWSLRQTAGLPAVKAAALTNDRKVFGDTWPAHIATVEQARQEMTLRSSVSHAPAIIRHIREQYDAFQSAGVRWGFGSIPASVGPAMLGDVRSITPGIGPTRSRTGSGCVEQWLKNRKTVVRPMG